MKRDQFRTPVIPTPLPTAKNCALARLLGILLCAWLLSATVCQADETAIKAAGDFAGGLIVRLDCTDSASLGALSGPGRLVHGLVKDARRVQPIRQELVAKRLGGTVNVSHLAGSVLPFIDNTVTLLIAESLEGISEAEVRRVLAPYGKALVRHEGGWRVALSEPWPETIDTWTHYMHGPGNNAVAQDKEIGPPRHMQWLGGPRWSRHHDHLASVNAMVTEKGKLFYIIDEGSAASILMPPKWRLVARDAFNGIVLWKRDIPQWWPHLWPLKSGPASLPRRLVAKGDEVYAPQSILDAVAAYNAATGEPIRVYKGSEGTEEIIVIGDTLLALTNPTQPGVEATVGSFGEEVEKNTKIYAGNRPSRSPIVDHFWVQVKSPLWLQSKRTIRAYRASTGEKLWERASKVTPLTLAANQEHVFFHDSVKIVALDLATGKDVFDTDPVPIATEFMMSFFGATLVVYEDVVVFAGGEKMNQAWAGWGLGAEQGQDTMTAFSAKTGKKLWSAPHPYGGYQSPEDLLIAQNLIWVADTANGKDKGTWEGHNLHTGVIEKEIPPTLETKWFHHRCYRSKATENFLLPSRNGIEFIDLEKKEWSLNNWVRSACLYGIMPANGFIYNAPHNCACHPMAKLNGFNALAPATASRAIPESTPEPLTKGIAYGKVAPGTGEEYWPSYRGGDNRSGASAQTIAPNLSRAWKMNFEGRMTQPVVKGDLLVLASTQNCTVYALDAASGRERWRHVAGGRVDSVPTLAEGYVLFGSADGYVTCLRASDGKLAWRFRAAPVDRRMVAFGQVESSWPVNGSVLIQNDDVVFTAGRSFHIDEGSYFYRLALATGEMKVRHKLDGYDANGKELQAPGGLNMPTALTDILSSDGETLYMRGLLLDCDGVRNDSKKYHLFAPYGFTDPEWFHRAYWVFGETYSGGHAGYQSAGRKYPSGRMIVYDDDFVYVYGREQKYYRWITEMEYKLFAAPRPDKMVANAPQGKKKKGAAGYQEAWAVKVPILVRGMVKAGDTLFLTGPPDLLNEDEAIQSIHLPEMQAMVREQDAAISGEKGALLWAVNAKDGAKLAEMRFDEIPAFDGLIAAAGNIYMSTTEGGLICFRPAD